MAKALKGHEVYLVAVQNITQHNHNRIWYNLFGFEFGAFRMCNIQAR